MSTGYYCRNTYFLRRKNIALVSTSKYNIPVEKFVCECNTGILQRRDLKTPKKAARGNPDLRAAKPMIGLFLLTFTFKNLSRKANKSPW